VIEVNVPELSIGLEPVVERLQGLWTYSVEPPLRVDANVDQPRILENTKVS
jgi:hypothetical protein